VVSGVELEIFTYQVPQNLVSVEGYLSSAQTLRLPIPGDGLNTHHGLEPEAWSSRQSFFIALLPRGGD
jgi:hypothetical protein